MHERYPGVQSALDYHDPFTLVVCVMLSAQTTDAGVNRVTPELFSRWPTPQAMAQADPAEVGEVIHSIGFWRAKAAHCVELSQMIMSDYGGEVPRTMEELCRLPGVGRKTANIVLNKAFGICEGIAVDTHVFRIATRMGFTRASTPAGALDLRERGVDTLRPRHVHGAAAKVRGLPVHGHLPVRVQGGKACSARVGEGRAEGRREECGP